MVFERMEVEISQNMLTARNVKWHKSCYTVTQVSETLLTRNE